MWVECDHCKLDAVYYDLHNGCYSCGGLDCGDTSYVGFYCEIHGIFFSVSNRIPLTVDPVEHCYYLLDEMLKGTGL